MHSVVTLTMPFLCVLQKEEVSPVGKEKEFRSKDSGPGLPVDLNHEDLYFPSVDLLTAQVHTRKALEFKFPKMGFTQHYFCIVLSFCCMYAVN